MVLLEPKTFGAGTEDTLYTSMDLQIRQRRKKDRIPRSFLTAMATWFR
jgi:hypothetical protein